MSGDVPPANTELADILRDQLARLNDERQDFPWENGLPPAIAASIELCLAKIQSSDLTRGSGGANRRKTLPGANSLFSRRMEFLASDNHIAAATTDCKETKGKKNPARHLVARGALTMLLARKAWLKEVSRSLAADRWGRSG
jgi:hypothetical protein